MKTGIKILVVPVGMILLICSLAAFYDNDLTKTSGRMGLVTVTLADANAARPSSQVCKSCRIRHFSGTATFVNPDGATDANATTDWPLGTTVYDIPIDNLNKLSFIGTTGDKIQIWWRR